MIVMLLSRVLKYILLALVLGFVFMMCMQLVYNVMHPILPDAFVALAKTKRVFIVKHYEGTALSSLGGLLYGSTFFFIGFKFFKDRNTFSKIFISSLIICVFVLLFFLISLITESKIAVYSLLAIPPIGTLYLLGKSFYKNRKSKNSNAEAGTKYEKKVKPKADGFIFQTDKKPIILNAPSRGIYIQGGAGSGKSLSCYEPIIQQIAEKKYTGLLYDFKSPELTKKLFYCYQNQSQIKPYFVDFKNPYISHRVNPIAPQYMPKAVHALEFSTVLMNNMLTETIKSFDFWTGNARMILAGCMLYIKNNYPYYCSLPHVISLLLHTDADKLINEISRDPEAGGMVASLKIALNKGADNQSSGVLSTLQNALSQLNSSDLFWILSGNDLSLHLNDPSDPKFLCLGNDSTLASTYAPIISLIISSATKQMNQPNQQRSIILLDEAPTIYIPNIEQIPATARSNKVSVVFGVQDYAQLQDKYGKDKAEVIISNLGNQFYGRTVNVESAKKVKELFGKEDRTYTTKNTGSGSSGEFIHLATNANKGLSESIQERDRVTIQQITNLKAGQFFGIIAEGTPKEFLKTQLKPSEIKGEYEFPIRATEEEIRANYLRIIEEAKSIIM